MADAVASQVLFSGGSLYVAKFTNISDATGESNVVKVDKSTLIGPKGVEPSTLTVEKIEYSLDGMAARLSWDHTTDVLIATLAGSGFFDWTEAGGLNDPGTGDTGDILLTTFGHAAGDSYTITLYLRLKG